MWKACLRVVAKKAAQYERKKPSSFTPRSPALPQPHAVAGERFVAEVEAGLALLQEAPERWPLFHLGTRRFVMAAFP